MEKEFENKNFDFNKKEIFITNQNKLNSEKIKRKIIFIAFFTLGSLTVGAGIAATNALTDSYLIEKRKNAEIDLIKIKNEESRKNELFQLELNKQTLKNEIDINEYQEKKIKNEQVNIEKEKNTYDIWIKNKSDIIANYQAQLNIYDKAYQHSVQAVKTGLIGLDDLKEIRVSYQEYRNNINNIITFISNSTISFDVYFNLEQDNKKTLDNELIKYQSGGLNRNITLESILMQKVSNKGDNDKLATLRNSTRNKMIDELADIISNDNVTTKSKILKR